MNANLMRQYAGADVSGLPTYGFGHRSLTWWGTVGMMVIEGTVFLGTIAAYFYLRERVPQWPPTGAPPALLPGTINLVVLLLSAAVNQWTKVRSEARDLRGVRRGLAVCLLFSMTFLVVRIFEYRALNTTYTGSAYGSVVFALLTLHTVHLITDFIDSSVLTALMFFGALDGSRFADVNESCIYWWFVVLSWLPIYFTIYIVPRL